MNSTKTTSMKTRLRIALIIETSRAYGRMVLKGINAYAREYGPWSFYMEERETGEAPPTWLKSWKGDGIISRVDDQPLKKAIQATGRPVVDLRGVVKSNFPVVKSDDRKIVELAVDHLLQRGFSNLAYCGFTDLSYSERRLGHLLEYLHEQNLQCTVHQGSSPQAKALQRQVERAGILFTKELAAWLRSLPKPVGIIACNDIRGQQILNVCRDIDIQVPEQVALIGVDNDETLCELSDPPMTSVELDTYRTGYEAAALLAKMIHGQNPSTEPMLIPPKAVVCRQSTDGLAVADVQVAAAVRYIRMHATDGLRVEDVASHVTLSRRLLERRFQKFLHRTPHAEITRVRIERIKQLLLETDWSLEAIAAAAGLADAGHLSVMFKKAVGTSPGQYRKIPSHRAGG